MSLGVAATAEVRLVVWYKIERNPTQGPQPFRVLVLVATGAARQKASRNLTCWISGSTAWIRGSTTNARLANTGGGTNRDASHDCCWSCRRARPRRCGVEYMAGHRQLGGA